MNAQPNSFTEQHERRQNDGDDDSPETHMYSYKKITHCLKEILSLKRSNFSGACQFQRTLLLSFTLLMLVYVAHLV